MRAGHARQRPRFRVDGVEQPPVLVYAVEHEVKCLHSGGVVLSVVCQFAVPERRSREQGRRRRVRERVRLVDIVQECPIALLQEVNPGIEPKSPTPGNAAAYLVSPDARKYLVNPLH